MERLKWIIAFAVIPIGFAMSYGLARVGHPSAYWMWCDMLRLCGLGSP